MLKLHVTTKYLSWRKIVKCGEDGKGGQFGFQSDRVITLEKSHTVNPWRVVFPEIVLLVLTSTCWPKSVMAGRLLKSIDTQADHWKVMHEHYLGKYQCCRNSECNMVFCLLCQCRPTWNLFSFLNFWVSWLFCVLIFILSLLCQEYRLYKNRFISK